MVLIISLFFIFNFQLLLKFIRYILDILLDNRQRSNYDMKNYLLIFLACAAISFCFFQYINQPVEIKAEMSTPEIKTENAIATPLVNNDLIDTLSSTLDSLKWDPNPAPDQYEIKAGFRIVNWKHLSRVKFDEQYTESIEAYVPYPIFHPNIIALDGKKISIDGYVIPIEETKDETLIILSALPFANCFFCGGAGPETVMDIQLNTKHKFKTDTKTTFRGRLKLNDSDLDYLNYILEEAEVVQ